MRKTLEKHDNFISRLFFLLEGARLSGPWGPLGPTHLGTNSWGPSGPEALTT